MKYNILLLLLLISSSFYGQRIDEDMLIGEWEFTELPEQVNTIEAFKPKMILNADHSFKLMKSDIQYAIGVWKLKENVIYLTGKKEETTPPIGEERSNKEKTESATIKRVTKNELVLEAGENSNLTLKRIK